MSTASASNATPSKTDFVRSYLNGNPTAGVRAVNEAWNAAGNAGSISDTLVHRLRSEKGLTGNVRTGRPAGSKATAAGGSRPSGTKVKASRGRRGRPPRSAAAPDLGAAPEVFSDSGGAGGLEAEFDRLLFRVMGQGMPDVEEAIRQARRLLVLSQGR
jgi:hypothetical protein